MRKERLYVLCTVCFAILAAGCNSVQQVLKSGRPDHMYQTALKHYQNQKWSKAAMLFEAAAPYYSGTMQEDSIAFMTAFCKFKTRDYEVATSMLDDFRRKFGRSVFLEDAEGILALSYFYLAPGPTRDQTMTTQAIVAVNEYLAHYPNSSRSDEFREMDKILTQRLHDKTYLNAYTYYKIGRYKSAIVALKNALKLYPTSSHREEIMYLIVKSGSKLADNSVQDKQADRYLSTLDSYYSFVAEFPESHYLKELDRLAQNAKDFLDETTKKNNNSMEIKKSTPTNTVTRKLVDLDKETGNIYETVNIIARRANQISTELKAELTRKLADFSSPTDTMEETFENREQIEISRYYERLPKPVLIATEEFLDGELFYKENKPQA